MTWNRVVVAIVAAVAVLGPAVAASDIVVDVSFHGTIDLGICRTYQWSEGTPSKNYLVEQTIHETVDDQLEHKGRVMVDDQADCFVLTHALTDPKFPAGLVKVEVGVRESGDLAWRGMASGGVPGGGSARVQKVVRKAIRKMFEQFPPLPREARGDER